MTSTVADGLREALDAALDESNNNPASPSPSAEDATDGTGSVDMGYEEHAPTQRRGSMTPAQEKERRASIKAIMADGDLTPLEKRKSIQHLMDGRRQSMSSSCHSSVGPSFSDSDNDDDKSFSDEDGTILRSERRFAISNEQTRHAEMQRPQCTHYDRKCTLIAPCCGAAFGCRICHDDCPVLPPVINKRNPIRRSTSLPNMYDNPDAPVYDDDDDEHHHTIDRFAVREVICRECYTRQSSKTNHCVDCNVRFGEYHCSICNLWMSDSDKPYHCSECGFCRVGGKENFQHCDDCGMCIDKSLYDEHNCKSGKYKANCPVCQEYLFSSRSASHEMPCGHAIHWDCFRQLAAHDSRCPVCKKTAETRERMQPTWDAMAAGIAMQPVPPELCRVVHITCNDCEKTQENRAWHFLGVQCWSCQSFNTVVDTMVCAGLEAHEFLEKYGDGKKKEQTAPEEGDGVTRQNSARRVNRRRSAI